MIGRVEDKLVLYDTLAQQIVETIGGPEIFRDPEGDTALSRDGKWIVNGAPTGATMHYTILRRTDRAYFKTENFNRTGYEGRRPAHRPGAVLEPRGRSLRVSGFGERWHAADVRGASPRPQMMPAVLLIVLACAATAAAQSTGVHVNHEKVDAALAKGGVIFDGPQVNIAGGHRDKPGALPTQKGTSIFYITDGGGVLAAGARTQRLSKGDVIVVPAGTAHSFSSRISVDQLSACDCSSPCCRAQKRRSCTSITTKSQRR